MATIDPRLIPLIGMLADIGLDWLVFEIMEGIRRGREPLESPEALRLAREQVRQGEQVRPVSKGKAGDFAPLVGDEQLEWAARHVADRIDAALRELDAAIGNLDDIMSSDAPGKGRDGLSAATAAPLAPVIVALADGDDVRKISRSDVAEASADLPALRDALDRWLQAARRAPAS